MFPQKHAGKDGTTEVEFIIDREGVVHLPRIVSASEPEFGCSAATAVVRWRFAPPIKAGEPVDARVRMQLDFRAAEPAPAAETPPTPTDPSSPAPAAGSPPPA